MSRPPSLGDGSPLLEGLGLVTVRIPLSILAGRTAHFLCNWKKLTPDHWVLQTVMGYRIEMLTTPWQTHRPVTVVPKDQELLLQEEITKLCQKGAVIPVDRVGSQSTGFCSTIFLVPKKDTKQMRPVVNLKPLNRFLPRVHFKMEGLHVVRDLLQKGDWLCRIDLKDAYFAIPVCKEHQPFLRFIWRSETYQFTCLPFGLASAPRVFTKVLRPVVGFLRLRGVRCVIYLDDLLIMASSREQAALQCAAATQLLESLGFLVNYSKSQIHPTQELTFLGLNIDSVKEELILPLQKLAEIRKQARKLISRQIVSARDLAQFVGKLSATALAIHPAPLHYRGLQRLKHQALRGSHNYSTQILLSPLAREDLEWWLHEASGWNGRSLQPTPPELELETDASQAGWGAYCQGTLTGGRWSEEEEHLHINELELLAALFSLKAFLKHARDISVLLKSDNVTTVAYINHLGGTKSKILVNISKNIWLWCLQRGITLKAQHLPGKENLKADFMSRHLRDRTDWVLNPALFNLINQTWGPLLVDLFATRFSHQLPRFSVGVQIRKRRPQMPSCRTGGTCRLMHTHCGV